MSVAELPLNVQLMAFIWAGMKMEGNGNGLIWFKAWLNSAPPLAALLPLNVQRVSVVPPPEGCAIAPPAVVEVLLLNVESTTVSVPKLAMPPPPLPVPVLPETTQLETVSVPSLRTPPPSAEFPLFNVRPEMVAVMPLLTASKRNAGVPPAVLRRTVNCPGPGPMMDTLLVSVSCPLVKLMI